MNKNKKLTAFDELYELWKKYFRCYIIGNEETVRQYFHLVIGVILTHMKVRIIYNKKLTVRCSNFNISSSGTGKGELMDATAMLIKALNKKAISKRLIPLELSERMADFSTAGWIGTIERVGKTIEPIYGILKTKAIILVPEGKSLFERGDSVYNLRHKLTSALDEPGTVTKRLRLGDITYDSTTSAAVATIPLVEVNMALTQEGFLQRFLISFKEFSKEERNNIDRRKADLKKLDFEKDIKPSLEELTNELIQLMLLLSLKHQSNLSIKIKKEDITEMQKIRIGLRERYFRNQYEDTREEIISAFYERIDLFLLKMSAHHAVIGGKIEIDIEDYKYAADAIKWHCESIGKLLDKLRTVVGDLTIKRKNVVFQIIKKSGGTISRGELLKILYSMYKNRLWSLGKTRTQQFVKNMADGGELRFRTLERGRKVYMLP